MDSRYTDIFHDPKSRKKFCQLHTKYFSCKSKIGCRDCPIDKVLEMEYYMKIKNVSIASAYKQTGRLSGTTEKETQKN